MGQMARVSRRVLVGGAVVLVSFGTGAQARPKRAADGGEIIEPVALPVPAPAREGFVEVSGARLWYWDTGGLGEVVILAHAGTGSGLAWGYQQPVLAKAGYRVIGYSRRGHARTEVTDGAPGSDLDDLHRLTIALGVSKFHGIGTAAGGGVMLGYAVAHPDRVRSLVIACSLGGVRDEAYAALGAKLRPAPFNQMPPEFRELGPSYRAADPEGTARWVALEKIARTGAPPAGRPAEAGLEWAQLETLKIPILWLTGDADLYTPPALLRLFKARTPGSALEIIQGAGHSAYWEQPKAFNHVVLGFLRGRR